MRFFDANVQLGRDNAWSGYEPITVAEGLVQVAGGNLRRLLTQYGPGATP